jgi:hypothetical protein
METFNDAALSAYFPGLVDVCQGEDGQLVYALLQDGELILTSEYLTETETFTLPEKKHFPFTLPRTAQVQRYFVQDDERLYDDLLLYLKRFSALDDEQWAIVAHYIFLTYLHDHPGIDYCGYLLFYAVPERGKSRTGKSVAFVAFRGIHLIELREPMIFRYSERLHGTLFFDLQDVSKKAEKGGCDDILLLRAEKGAKCSRVQAPELGPFLDTVYYDIYGPTIFASNEQLHKILETRCLPIIMPNRPGNYENPRPELALELKERLTAWRAKHLATTFAEPEPMDGIAGRLWDITKPMFFVNSLLPVAAQVLKDAILAIAGEKEEGRQDSLEGRLVAIIREITEEKGLNRCEEWSIKTNEIRNRYNEHRPEEKHVSPQWIGKRLKSMSLHNRTVQGYAEIKITSGEYALILQQYGQSLGESARTPHSLPHSLPDKAEPYQIPLGVVESGRELATDRGRSRKELLTFGSLEEKNCYYAKLNALKAAGGLSQVAMEALAWEAVEEIRGDDAIPF